jgi:hypothetical protein
MSPDQMAANAEENCKSQPAWETVGKNAVRRSATFVTLEELAEAVTACEHLSDAVRAGILAMICATVG